MYTAIERWIQNQKDNGFKGAESVSSRVNNLYKWSAVTGSVEKWKRHWRLEKSQHPHPPQTTTDPKT